MSNPAGGEFRVDRVAEAGRAPDPTGFLTVSVGPGSTQSKAVTLTQPYVCQIHSHQHIEVRASEAEYLGAIPIREGQTVKRDDLLFRVRPIMDREKLDIENEDKVVSIKAPRIQVRQPGPAQ